MSRIDTKSLSISVADLWTILQSINLFGQCIGSFGVGPLLQKYNTRNVLSIAILIFGFIIALIPILEICTGGMIPTQNNYENKQFYGSWSPYILFFIFPLSGIFYGTVELIRRVIPSQIVGADSEKLKKIDSTVHIWYEVFGTTGAFVATYTQQRFGYAFGTMFIPIGFLLASIAWSQLKLENIHNDNNHVFSNFFKSIYVGAKIVLTSRKFIWLVPAYVLPLIIHRYFENTFFPLYSRYNLGDGSVQQILVGGSNVGELLGATAVFFFGNYIHTPFPWIRLDAISLLMIYFYVFFNYPDQFTKTNKNNISYLSVLEPNLWAWKIAAIGSIISFGWASGDVSLSAYIQEHLSIDEELKKKFPNINLLSAVMSFLYVSYLVLFFGLNIGVTNIFTRMAITSTDINAVMTSIHGSWLYLGGVFFSVSAIIIFISTFIPKNSVAFNPVNDMQASMQASEKKTELVASV